MSLEIIKPLFDWTSVRWNKCLVLYDLAKQATGPIVELGAYDGNGTLALALGSQAGNRVPVYAVDKWERFTGLYRQEFYSEDYTRFMTNVETIGVQDVVVPMKGDSEFIGLDWINGKIDLLVWDISLPRLVRDWTIWHRRVSGLFVAKDTLAFDFGWQLVKMLALESGWQPYLDWPEACLWSVKYGG